MARYRDSFTLPFTQHTWNPLTLKLITGFVRRRSWGPVSALTSILYALTAWGRALLHKLTVAQQPIPLSLADFNPNSSVLTNLNKISQNKKFRENLSATLDLVLRTCFLEVLGSNLGLNTDYCEVLHDSPQSLHADSWELPWIRSRPLPRPSPVHSLIILPLDAIQSKQLTASLNKPQTNKQAACCSMRNIIFEPEYGLLLFPDVRNLRRSWNIVQVFQQLIKYAVRYVSITTRNTVPDKLTVA
jgi:hypothetical protein